MEKLKKYPLLILFAGIILTLFIVDMLIPNHGFSEMENRELAKKPQMTWRNLTSKTDNQKFSTLYEKYTNDQFVGRNGWITLKSVSESMLGKIENNGILYGSEKRMFEKYLKIDDWRIDKNIGFVSSYINAYRDKTAFTFSIIPNSYSIYGDLMPKGINNVDQRAYVAKIYSQIPESAATLDLFPVMESAKQSESLYYRTDHHWTSEGAYYAYKAFIESKDMVAVELEEVRTGAKDIPGFYGTYYSKCKLFSTIPDTITSYSIPFTSLVIDGVEKPTLNEDSKWNSRDKHAAFLWGNNGLTVLKSDNNLNHNPNDISRILLIKDSYGNSFAPLLSFHYDEVYVVDLRYLNKISSVMDTTDFDDVLIQYNFMNFASDTNLAWLTY